MYLQIILWFNYSPRIGILSLVAGMFSAITNMKTVIESNTVIPRETFSPELHGRTNSTIAIVEMTTHGTIKLTT